jgi:hypothetical protein
MCQAIAQTQVSVKLTIQGESKMNTTKLSDEETLKQCCIWLIRYNKNPRNAQKNHAEFLKGVIAYYDQNKMISRAQRMQVDALLWTTTSYKFNKKRK